MDGRAFLDSVRHLLTAPSEANWRSAAGPLHCAVLNEARVALERWGFAVPARADLHVFILPYFARVPNRDLVRVADVLTQLHAFRDEADFSLGGPGLFADDYEVNRLLVLAETGIDVLDQLETDVARRAVAIAAIHAVFP
jgi:hypothetical protein